MRMRSEKKKTCQVNLSGRAGDQVPADGRDCVLAQQRQEPLPAARSEQPYIARATAMVALRDDQRGGVLLSAPPSHPDESRQPGAEQEHRGGFGNRDGLRIRRGHNQLVDVLTGR